MSSSNFLYPRKYPGESFFRIPVYAFGIPSACFGLAVQGAAVHDELPQLFNRDIVQDRHSRQEKYFDPFKFLQMFLLDNLEGDGIADQRQAEPPDRIQGLPRLRFLCKIKIVSLRTEHYGDFRFRRLVVLEKAGILFQKFSGMLHRGDSFVGEAVVSDETEPIGFTSENFITPTP